MLERVYDVCMVQSFEIATHGMVQQVHPSHGGAVQLEHCIVRIQFHGTGQPHRLHRQRRPIQSVATKSHPGVYFSDGFHGDYDTGFQKRNLYGQPPHWILLPGISRLFYIQEIGWKFTRMVKD